MAEEAGFEIRYYENCDEHMQLAYGQLSEAAAEYDFRDGNGAPLTEAYASTAKAAANREIGKQLAVLAI